MIVNKLSDCIILLFILILGLLTTIVDCNVGVGHAARVLELSDRFLDVRKDGVWLVKFYAPWCGHCKRLEPIFNHVAQALHDTNIRVARVDCTRFPSVASEFSVRGFPTIMFIHGDRIGTYNGERITEEIVDYAKKMNGPHISNTTLDPSEIEGIFFGYSGPSTHSLWEEFNLVAKEFQDTDRYFFFSKPNEETSESPVVIHRKSNGLIVKHKHEEGKQLRDFVSANRFDSYVRVTRSNFHRLIQTKKWIAMGVIEEDKLGRSADHHINFRELVGGLVETIDSEKFQLCWTTAVDFISKFVTVELETPYLIVINSSNYEHYLLHEEEGWSPERITSYLTLVDQGGGDPQGGNTLLVRLYRTYYELKTNLFEMWIGNPILTTVLFGLPLGFLSLIIYSICCADFMDEEEPTAEEDQRNHEKRE